MPVVQTIASPPRSFADPQSLFFGDVLVAQSAWTRSAIETSYEGCGVRAPRIEVIPPPVPDLDAAQRGRRLPAVRRELGLTPEQRYLLYPGDLETSSGAEATAALAERVPDGLAERRDRVCLPPKVRARRRSRDAPGRALAAGHTRFLENAPNILALLAGAAAVVFPVDDLWGKVDLPIVLLEAMALGVPVLVLDQGPLRDLEGVVKVASLDAASWLAARFAACSPTPNAARRLSAASARRWPNATAAAVVARAYEDLYLELVSLVRAQGAPQREVVVADEEMQERGHAHEQIAAQRGLDLALEQDGDQIALDHCVEHGARVRSHQEQAAQARAQIAATAPGLRDRRSSASADVRPPNSR